jgi:hypothetical protein
MNHKPSMTIKMSKPVRLARGWRETLMTRPRRLALDATWAPSQQAFSAHDWQDGPTAPPLLLPQTHPPFSGLTVGLFLKRKEITALIARRSCPFN